MLATTDIGEKSEEVAACDAYKTGCEKKFLIFQN